jgi:tetratricopeptide (TPR) repeat protein
VVDPVAGVPEDVRDALAVAPEAERALLELRLAWPELRKAEERIAARLRVFLLTWDPLEWVEGRAPWTATVTGDGDSYEVVLYLLLEEVGRGARTREETLAAALDACGSSVLAVGTRHEQLLVSDAYAQLAFAGQVPGLLSEVGSLAPGAAPRIALASPGWEPIGLGAIQDLVQETFGPVDLDRSPVRLEAAGELTPGCPACAGRRFGFPGELEEQRSAMCSAHAEQAQAVTAERLERAPKSNPDGWEAIMHASALLGEPTFGLPLALLRRLEEVMERDPEDRSSSADLRGEAELALALAERFAGRPEQLAELVTWEDYAQTWLIELPMALASAGLVDEAVAVGDALAELDDPNRALFANDVAVILAEAGRGDEALGRVEANLRRFPDDVWTQIHAGDVHARLSDPVRAEAAFREALAMARATADAEDVAGALERLNGLLAGVSGREGEARDVAREFERARRAASGGPRLVVKIGRNDRCPCGSGRKYKRCCGA